MSKRNENRPGYRKTEVGWIPEGWEILPFSECCNIGQGQVDPTDSKYQNLPHIGPENIESNSGRILGVKTAIELGLISGKYLFDRRAIVYSKIRPNLNKLCAPWFEGLCSADCYPLWPKNENLKEYIFQFMLSPQFLKQSIPVSLRTGMPKINREDLSLLRVTLPPIPEQKKIAEILSTWDEAIDQTRKLIEAKKRRKKALMQQLLTGKRRLPGFGKTTQQKTYRFFSTPEGWRCPRLREVATECSERNSNGDGLTVFACSKHLGFVPSAEYFGKQIFSEDTSSYKVIRRGWFGYPSNHVEEGSIGLLLTHDAGLVSPIYTVFRCAESIVPEYLYAVFKTDTFRHIFAVSTNVSVDRRGSLRWKEFSLIHIPQPSKEEQYAIVSVLKAADIEIKILEQKLSAFEKQKRGLMQKLLTGEVRVRI